MSSTSKPLIYVFKYSNWVKLTLLAIEELGYAPDQIEKKETDLVKGENFEPEFVKLNPNATIPVLLYKDEVVRGSNDVISWLIKHAPNPPKSDKPAQALISALHSKELDVNAAMLAARNEDELKAARAGVPKLFITTRAETLKKNAALITEPPEAVEMFKQRIALNDYLSSVYADDAPEALIQDWFQKSNGIWSAVASYIKDELPKYIPNGEFISGTDRPGAADFHLAGWLSNDVRFAGGDLSAKGVLALEKELGEPVPKELVTYWGKWTERPSWKTVFGAEN